MNSAVRYITEYFTKAPLKSHQVFSSMYNVLTNNSEVVREGAPLTNYTRKMIVKIVNNLSAKMEMGAPMAAMYLLGNPDHYKSHEFECFYWRNFVSFVERQWTILMDFADCGMSDGDNFPGDDEYDDVGIEQLVTENGQGGSESVKYEPRGETVRLTCTKGSFVGKSSTNDYRFRPDEHTTVSLYEWIQCSRRMSQTVTWSQPQHLQFYCYQPDHLLYDSHAVACDPEQRLYIVPNFIGPMLPCRDQGDRKYYCMTMLTFFALWRSGIDLKASDQSWEDAFNQHHFSAREIQIMDNFNLRYECYNTTDDLRSTLSPKGQKDNEGFVSDNDMQTGDDYGEDNGEDLAPMIIRPQTQKIMERAQMTVGELKQAGWCHFTPGHSQLHHAPNITLDLRLNSMAWNHILTVEKTRLWKQCLSLIHI